jgi:hypothetical protein
MEKRRQKKEMGRRMRRKRKRGRRTWRCRRGLMRSGAVEGEGGEGIETDMEMEKEMEE